MRRDNAYRILLAAGLSLGAIDCGKNDTASGATRTFRRYGAQMTVGGMPMPQLPNEALTTMPSVVRLVGRDAFEVDASVAQWKGRYRLEGDSIFLDDESGAEPRLAFAGRLFNDTLHLHFLPDYPADSNEARWQLFFVRSR